MAWTPPVYADPAQEAPAAPQATATPSVPSTGVGQLAQQAWEPPVYDAPISSSKSTKPSGIGGLAKQAVNETPWGDLSQKVPAEVGVSQTRSLADEDAHPRILTLPDGHKGTYNSASNLQKAMNEARKKGINLGITSGLRTNEEQTKLYENRFSNPYPVAAPGTSNHETGISYDLHGDLEKARPILEKYGFAQPLPDKDPVHWTFQPEATGSERIWADGDTRLARTQSKAPKPGSNESLALANAKSHNWTNEDASIWMEQLRQESNFRQDARSPVGASGIGQMMPETLRPYLQARDISPWDYAHNPAVQIDIAREHMEKCLKDRKGNWALALSDYNAGAGGTRAQQKTGRAYRETRDYVAQILGVDPQTAAQWILDPNNKGPVQNSNKSVPNDAAFQDNMKQSTLSMMAALGSPDALPPGMLDAASGQTGLSGSLIQGASDSYDVLKRRNPEMSASEIGATMALDPVKGMMRGMLSGVHQIGAWEQSQLDNLETLGTGGKVASTMVRNALPGLSKTVPWAKLAKELEPSNMQRPEQDYINHLRGGKDFMHWVGGLRPSYFGGTSSLFDMNAAQANVMSLGMEAPELFGMMSMGHVLGGVGQAAKVGPYATHFGAPSAALNGMLREQFPAVAEKMGGEFFANWINTTGIASSQMFTQGVGESLARGETPIQAATAGIANAVLGTMVGSIAHFGLPITKFLGTKAVQSAPAQAMGEAANQGLDSLIRQAMVVAGDRTHPFNLKVKPAITNWLKKAVDPDGKLIATILDNAARYERMAQQQISDRYRTNQVGVLQAESQNVGQLSQGLQQWAELGQKELTAAQEKLQTAQMSADAFVRGNPQLMMSPVFMEAVEMLKTRGKGLPMEPGQAQHLSSLLKKLTPMDSEARLAAINALALEGAEQNLAKVSERVTPQALKDVQEILGVTEWTKNTLDNHAIALDANTYKIDPRALDRQIPGGELPLPYQEGLQNKVTDELHAAIQEAVVNNNSLGSAFAPRISQLVTQTTRSLADNMKFMGDTPKKLNGILTDIEIKRQDMLAVKPTLKNVMREDLTGMYDPAYKSLSGKTTYNPLDREDIFKTSAARNAAKADYKAKLSDWEKSRAEFEDTHRPIEQALKKSLASMGETTDITGKLVLEKVKAAKSALNEKMKSLGVSFDVLDNLYNAKPQPVDSVLQTYRDAARKEITAIRKGAKEQEQIRALLSQSNDELLGYKRQADPRLQPLKWAGNPIYPAALRRELTYARDNGLSFAKVEVPLAWVENLGSAPGKTQSIQANRLANVGSSFENRPILGGEVTDAGKLSVIDGRARVEQFGKDGKGTVSAFVRQDHLDKLIEANLPPDVHGYPSQMRDYAAGVFPDGPISSEAMLSQGIHRDARNAIAGLSYNEAQEIVGTELTNLAETFKGVTNPSAVRFGELFQDGVSPDYQYGSALKQQMDRIQGLGSSIRELTEKLQPKTIQDSLSHAQYAFRDMTHIHDHAKTVGMHLGTAINADLYKAFDAGTVPVKLVNGRLPQEFSEMMVDAMQSMTTDQSQMQNFLRKYPGMKEVLGGYFDMGRMIENWKMTDPTLKAMFNAVWLPQRFPELRNITKTLVNKGDNEGAMRTLALASEHEKAFPTLAAAREVYAQAESKVLNSGNWQGLKKPPPTPEGKLERFINMSIGEKRNLLPGMSDKELEKTVMNLGLRNPVMDLGDLVSHHVSSMIQASAKRDLVRKLANIPVPGMGINPMTGKPTMLLDYYPSEAIEHPNGQVDIKTGKPIMLDPISPPAYPTIGTGREMDRVVADIPSPGASKYARPVPLNSNILGMSDFESVPFAGQDVPSKHLYLQADAANMLQHYYATGEPATNIMAKINRLTRTAALCLGPAVHLFNINAMHTSAMLSYNLQGMAKSMARIGKGVVGMAPAEISGGLSDMGKAGKGALLSPLAGAVHEMAGQELGANLHFRTDAALHGAKTDVLDAMVSGIARQTAALHREAQLPSFADPNPKSKASQVLDSITDRSPSVGASFHELRTAQGMGAQMQQLANLGLTATEAMEHYTIFQPIQNALYGAYANITHMHWSDMGAKLMAQGLPQETALRLCKNEAANFVNKMSGALQSYQDPQGLRTTVYNSLLGQLVLAPGWLRTKAHTLAALGTDNMVNQVAKIAGPTTGLGEYGHLNIIPEMRRYAQANAASQIGVLLASGYAGMQLMNFLINGHSTAKNDPSDPKASWKVKVGDKLYTYPSWGALGSFVTAGQRTMEEGPLEAVLALLADQAQPQVKALDDLRRNQDFAGRPIFDKDAGNLLPPGSPQWLSEKAGQQMDMARYAAHRTLDLDDVTGSGRNYRSIGEHLVGIAGFKGSEIKGPEKIDRIIKDNDTFYHNKLMTMETPELGGNSLKEAIRQRIDAENRGDRAAANKIADRYINYATEIGIPNGQGGTYKMPPRSLSRLEMNIELRMLKDDNNPTYRGMSRTLKAQRADYLESLLGEKQ